MISLHCIINRLRETICHMMNWRQPSSNFFLLTFGTHFLRETRGYIGPTHTWHQMSWTLVKVYFFFLLGDNQYQLYHHNHVCSVQIHHNTKERFFSLTRFLKWQKPVELEREDRKTGVMAAVRLTSCLLLPVAEAQRSDSSCVLHQKASDSIMEVDF